MLLAPFYRIEKSVFVVMLEKVKVEAVFWTLDAIIAKKLNCQKSSHTLERLI